MLYNIIAFSQKGLESSGLHEAQDTAFNLVFQELVWLGYHLVIFMQNATDSSKKREVKNKTYTTSNIIRIDIINVI